MATAGRCVRQRQQVLPVACRPPACARSGSRGRDDACRPAPHDYKVHHSRILRAMLTPWLSPLRAACRLLGRPVPAGGPLRRVEGAAARRPRGVAAGRADTVSGAAGRARWGGVGRGGRALTTQLPGLGDARAGHALARLPACAVARRLASEPLPCGWRCAWRRSGNWLVPAVADKLLHMELEEEAGTGRVSSLAQQYLVRRHGAAPHRCTSERRQLLLCVVRA